MTFEALAAELLAHPVDQFTQRRNARVKALKASGRADLASQLSGLKKPSLPLWAANQVAAHNRPRLDELRIAGQALIKAQAAAAAGRANAARELRAASEEFQQRLEAAGNAAASALRDGGHAAGEDALRRIREILRLAGLQGGDTWRQLEMGAMTTEPRPGEDMLEVFGMGRGKVFPLGGRAGEGVSKRAEARRDEQRAQKAARVDAGRAQRATATARRLRQEATEATAAAERAAERAKAAEDEATHARSQAEKSQRAARGG